MGMGLREHKPVTASECDAEALEQWRRSLEGAQVVAAYNRASAAIVPIVREQAAARRNPPRTSGEAPDSRVRHGPALVRLRCFPTANDAD